MSSFPLEHPYSTVAELMAGFGRPWFMCGGWAADAWLGRVTREHGDIDISVFIDDQRALFEYLDGWNLIAHDANLVGPGTDFWDGHELVIPAHLHARQPGEANRAAVLAQIGPGHEERANDGLDFDFVFNERSAEDWVLHRAPEVALPLERCVADAGSGVPMARPELLMFWKATAYPEMKGWLQQPKNESDFLALLLLLTAEEREWLAGAIAAGRPEHDWLRYLGRV